MSHGHREPAAGEDRWSASYWDERYASQPALWSGNANAVVVAEATPLRPGRALDVGSGEGGDALWLAAQGWEVVGVDVSVLALGRAAGHAETAGVSDRITWERHDLLAWTPPRTTYDLVSVPFFHLPSVLRRGVYAGLADAVAPGGWFLVVAHHPLDFGTTVPRPPEPDLFFTAEELAEQLDDGWEVVTCEARPRLGKDPEGREVTLHDTVLRARRG